MIDVFHIHRVCIQTDLFHVFFFCLSFFTSNNFIGVMIMVLMNMSNKVQHNWDVLHKSSWLISSMLWKQVYPNTGFTWVVENYGILLLVIESQGNYSVWYVNNCCSCQSKNKMQASCIRKYLKRKRIFFFWSSS